MVALPPAGPCQLQLHQPDLWNNLIKNKTTKILLYFDTANTNILLDFDIPY